MPDRTIPGVERYGAVDLLQRRIPHLVARLLTQAGAPKALQAKVMAVAQEWNSVTGMVMAVTTSSNNRTIIVGGFERGETFEFPPNGRAFEEELIRAQDAGRDVTVVYRWSTQGHPTIDDIWVYAGTSLPRY